MHELLFETSYNAPSVSALLKASVFVMPGFTRQAGLQLPLTTSAHNRSVSELTVTALSFFAAVQLTFFQPRRKSVVLAMEHKGGPAPFGIYS